MNSIIKKLKEFFDKKNINFTEIDGEHTFIDIYPNCDFNLGELVIILNNKTEIKIPIIHNNEDKFSKYVIKTVYYNIDCKCMSTLYNFFYEDSEKTINLIVNWDEEKGEYLEYFKNNEKQVYFLKDIKAIKFI